MTSMLIAFHKPFGILCQFTPDQPGQRTLAEFGFPGDVYSIGRLDHDSEGLLLLSNEAPLVSRLLNPSQAHPRTYHAQVEGVPEAEKLKEMERGIIVQGRKTLPCKASTLDPQPLHPPRQPPIRVRLNIPDTWISLTLIEGRNRQVRRMTAAIGHPTLRLMRVQIGKFPLGDLAAGAWKEVTSQERQLILSS